MSIDKKSRKTKRPQHQANREDQRATGYGRRGEAQVGMGELLTVKEVAAKLEVEFGLGGPALRAVIHALRETGHPICSNSKGYFIGSREDVLSTIESLDQRARLIQSTVDGLRLSLKRINVKPGKLEQMEMF
jgi:hypothetical protein